jgi:hypothetical protein
MASLYKYMKRKYADAMLAEGSVKIGTLYEFWAMEALGNEVGDRYEGRAFCEIPGQRIDEILSDNDPSYMARWVRETLASAPEARYFKTFIACHQTVDQFIYCTTSEFDAGVMASFGCDTCVEIWNPPAFLELITRGMAERAIFRGAYHCNYRRRSFDYIESSMIGPETIKDPQYAHQKEVRAVWLPKAFQNIEGLHPTENPLAPLYSVIVSSPALAECCRLHTVVDGDK